MQDLTIAVVGATGAVGVEFLRIIENRYPSLPKLKLLASSRSAGKRMTVGGKELVVEEAAEDSFDGVDLAFISANSECSRRLAPAAVAAGAVVIDDAYNASPETVVNLIETLNDRPERVKVVVLGPLAELEEGLADTAARIAGSLGPPLSRCIVYDPDSSQLFDGLERAGTRVALEMAGTQAELFAALKALDAPDTVVGIKGSRSAHMERAVQALLGTQVACRLHPCALLRYCTDCDDLTGI